MSANLVEDSYAQIRKPLHSEMLGISDAVVKVRALIKKVAPSNLTVFITGETGTGKDLAARMVHDESLRKSKPFVKVNCPSIQETLVESEFYGHEKGAFTGAVASSPGWIEKASEGTLFLDEISEISTGFQSKLAQAFDGEPFMRVGGVRLLYANARIVSATNVPIEEIVERGKLAESLLFRLAESVVRLAPLRERREDIPILAEHFNFNLSQQLRAKYVPIPSSVMREMQEMEWVGNIRELSARVKEYLVSGSLDALVRRVPNMVSDVPEGHGNMPADGGRVFMPLPEAVRQAVEKTEISLIREALEYTLWNRRKAAKILGISYSSLLRRIDAYGIGE